jgi:N-methylhydantoinase A/oxoprolinase/acetone carboxylase beta subunit
MQRKFKTRLAADIGGTFTDVAAFDQKTLKLLLGKTLYFRELPLTTEQTIIDSHIEQIARINNFSSIQVL